MAFGWLNISEDHHNGRSGADTTHESFSNTLLTQNSANGVENPISKENTATVYACAPKLRDVEDLSKYRQGGYHPVHLGDEFGNGRYRVLHKLGYGGLSTVWLARDTETKSFVALKVMVAMASDDKERNEIRIWTYLKQPDALKHPARKHLCMLLNSFKISGPNGTHSCLVYPVTGFSIGGLSRMRLRGSVVRRIAYQLIETVAYLHSEGICHGDLTASNVTLKLGSLDHWTDTDLERLLGPAKSEELKMPNTHDPVPARYPKYVVRPVDLSRIDPILHTEDMVLIDFGEAFFINNPPSSLGTPEPYRSPSLWFKESPGISSDLWALGCTLFNLRAGFDLIYDALVAPGPSDSIRDIINYLGPLPERWNRLYIDLYGVPQPREKIGSKIRRLHREEGQEDLLESWEEGPAEQPLRTISYLICDNYHGPIRPEDEEEAAELGASWQPDFAKVKIPAEEAEAFGDILERLMCYEAKDQTPAADLLVHRWLTASFPDNTPAADATPLFQSNYPAYA